ncbi:hypothetical protein AGMMS50268_32590 [Spirochaetia bacterium]|nr:hypothetical protein AGMMS50268_32550 [Spirochaetia bacterium]GHV92756.1 hypothetical protein AGMMS50268_32590 [Spirochaetia bacterium]
MRFFVCALGEITLALPADSVARIIPVSRNGSALVEIEGGSGDAYLSLPLALKKGECQVHHGIVLKRCPGELLAALRREPPIQQESSARVILSTPKIETDLDIPDGDIRSLPAFMGQPEMLPWLSGAVFSGAAMILIVDMELLLKKISAMAQKAGAGSRE